MPVQYTIVARKNPLQPEDPPKYYPSIQSSGRTSPRQLAQLMANISTLNPIDMAAALEAFLQVVPAELARGNIVELGDFGSFWLRTQSDGEEAQESVTRRNIKSIKPQFRPGKEFKNSLNTISFVKK